jgi:hypothetical protein
MSIVRVKIINTESGLYSDGGGYYSHWVESAKAKSFNSIRAAKSHVAMVGKPHNRNNSIYEGADYEFIVEVYALEFTYSLDKDGNKHTPLGKMEW